MKVATELPLAAGGCQAVVPRSSSRLIKLGLLVAASYAIYLQLWIPARLQRASRRTELLVQEWKDDIWPLRPQTPWDISTDYPFPRKLEYDVDEGTWLRLDVNTKSGDIVFDMLGDIYCLPTSAYLSNAVGPTKARPVLLGVPHDSDPHFSPDGTKLVFRSDAELGYENIWVTEWKGCDAMDVRSEDASEELVMALLTKDEEEEMLANGVRETEERTRRRLTREGRATAYRVTNETHRWVSDARFHPSGIKVVATKWHFSSRSLGAGEGWEYSIPESSEDSVEAGRGKRLVGRTLPVGWGPEDYGDQQIGPEQFIWQGEDAVIYAKNVIDTNGQWTYSKDVHSGIYAIYSTNLTSQHTSLLVSNSPGGASRPELSRDGRTLAFVRRVRDKETLVFKDLITGTIHHVWDGLTYDLSTVSAPMGTYPSFGFTPDDSAVIIWAAGQIWRVPVAQNALGERVASKESPKTIPFTVHVEKRLAETVTTSTNLVELEQKETERVRAFTDLRVNEDGSKAVFQASGKTYVYDINSKHVTAVPTHDEAAPYFSPSFVPGLDNVVIQATWSDTNFTTFELADLASGSAVELSGLPQGRFSQAVLCSCSGRKRLIAFVKTASTYLTGNVVATANAGLYVGEITLPHHWTRSKHDTITIKNVRFVSSITNGDSPTQTKIRFLEVNKKLLVQQTNQAVVIDLAAGPDEFGEYKHETIASGEMSMELAAVPTSANSSAVAFVDFYHVYFAPSVGSDEAVWSKPGKATKGLARLSVDGGHHVVFSGDGKKLFWFLGPYLHHIELSKLDQCKSDISKDELSFGIACTKNILEYQEVVVEYPTDYARLKKEAHLSTTDDEARANADFVVFSNATLLTMESGNLYRDILHDAVLVTRGGSIEAIVGREDLVLPYGATVIDAQGGFIVPGFIDVHAHWNGFEDFYPSRSWELETFLAYGITTLHNPSADNTYGSNERFRVERGQLNGPRIFHVGNVIYGAEAGIHQEINSMEDAFSALIRIKAEGGPSSWSYKNYNLPSRAMRQRLLLAARKLGMLCVPEGGMNYDWDQTYIVDGMTTIEHALPVPRLYYDVMTLFALSGTGLTPTHIVNYGGVFGEQYVWANEDIPNDPKLRRFTRHDILETLSESTARPRNSYALFNTSESTAKMVQMGLKAHIGAHGEPPLGLNYHEEMFFAKLGGLTNYEVIRAATSDAAKTLGLYSSLGSLTPGKLADFVVYPPGFDLLHGDIHRTRDIRYVVRGGRVWDAETMVEVWPVKGRRPAMPPINPED